MVQSREATIEELYLIEEKAELIDGRVTAMGSTGYLPSVSAGQIYVSIYDYALKSGMGIPCTDNITYEVNLPQRENVKVWVRGRNEPEIVTLKQRRSFSPDVSFHLGQPPANPGDAVPGAPSFAVEVRSKNDYGERAERAIACKIADYFEAGTSVVWDVDVLQERLVRAYTAPTEVEIFGMGDEANAEPVMKGWRFSIESLFNIRWIGS